MLKSSLTVNSNVKMPAKTDGDPDSIPQAFKSRRLLHDGITRCAFKPEMWVGLTVLVQLADVEEMKKDNKRERKIVTIIMKHHHTPKCNCEAGVREGIHLLIFPHDKSQ